MQTLGVSSNAPPSEGRFKTLFWPTIETDIDIDNVTRQGFWICMIIGAFTFVIGLFTSPGAILDALFFFAAAIGVRNHSIPAAGAVLLIYVLERLLLVRLGQNPIGVMPVLTTALLLSNLRATWIAAKLVWVRTTPPPPPLAGTFGEKFANVFPLYAWKYVQWIFWPLFVLLLLGCISLIAGFQPPAAE